MAGTAMFSNQTSRKKCWNCPTILKEGDVTCHSCGESQDNWFKRKEEKLASCSNGINPQQFTPCPPPTPISNLVK